MQKMVAGGAKLPFSFENYQKKEGISMGLLKAKRGLKSYLKDSIKVQKELFALSETEVKFEVPQESEDELTADTLYSALDKNYLELHPFLEETVDRWNQRTQIMKNLNTTNSKNKAFNKTILEQVGGILDDPSSLKKLIDKTQLNREHFRIIGRPAADLTMDRDPNIYNDFDFYQGLLKDFLGGSTGESAGGNGINNDADDIYVDGADLSITQKFLERRRKLQEAAAAAKVKKQVDRKASKNRKIRYVVHEKIVNFMTPEDNLGVSTSKEALLKTLFGQKMA